MALNPVRTQVMWPKPGRVLLALIGANVVCYILQLVLMRAGASFVMDLSLTPAAVFERGFVWQVFTYSWLHAPEQVMHLLFNMLFLYMFGAQLEPLWGGRRLFFSYVIFGLGGAALTLLVGGLAAGPLERWLPGFYGGAHLGASGAVMGVTIAWGLVFADKTFNFLLIGEMKGKTFILLIVGFQLLTALSYEQVSSTAHFGGMIAAFILCRGLWRPSKVKGWFKRRDLERRRKKVELELRVIEGGKGTPDKDDPSKWN